MDMQSLIHQGSSSNSNSSATVSSSNGSFPAPIVSAAVPVAPFAAMQSQPTIFQRSAVPSAVSQASTLAPLRFIIPNGNSFSHNGANFLATVPSTNQLTFNINEPDREPQPKHSMLYPQDCMKTDQQEISSVLSDQKQSKKMMPKRTRTSKLSSRSTKSKARPGLRKGKWTEEESRFAAQLTNCFKEGLLPLERGTMLRLYLSQMLNCEPMRITKKFTGGECIGKQVFRPCSLTPESRARMMQAQLELVALEAAFIKRLKINQEDPPDDLNVRLTSFGHRSRPVPLKPRRTETYELGDDDKEGDVEDANAVGLLLDFFYKANRNEKKGDKKAGLTKKDEFSAENIEKEIEGAQIKKESTEISTPTSPATNSESDTSVISPTKRMRALSVSGCVDPAASKRSRVGSFSTFTAV